MRYFFHENAALPLQVGSKNYAFDVTERIAGTVQGVLAIADDAESSAFKEATARWGVTEIDQATYDAEIAKKKRRDQPWLRANYDPSVRPAPSTPPAPSAAPAVNPVKAEATSFKGSGNAIVVPEGSSGEKPVESLPSADDVFGTGKMELDLESGTVRAEGTPKPEKKSKGAKAK